MSFETPPADSGKIPVYVYDWNAWTGSLFSSIDSSAIKIEAKIRQSNSSILKKVVANKGYFLFHINLTKTTSFFKNKDDLLTRLRDKGITPLNAEIDDTSKKYLQSICVKTGLNVTRATVSGDENELLIIKTNLNYGGKPEKKLLRSEFRRLKPAYVERDVDTDINYPVMERKKIKSEVWNSENLIVEKYITNEHNYIYRVYKLLNKIVISEAIENNVIKKMISVIQRINYYFELNDHGVLSGGDLKFNDLLAAVIPLCNTLKVDFAAIDVVKSDDNKFYIIDVNLTPNWNRKDQTEITGFLGGALSNKV